MTRLPFVLALALAFAIGCAKPAARPQWSEEQSEEFFRQLFDTMVDRHLEAGYEDPTLVTSDATLDRRIIVVTSALNERTAKDVVARLLYLDRQDPRSPIHLVLSTQGGWGDTTFAIIDAIEMIHAPVDVWGVGGVYSGGAMVLASGTGRRVVSQNAIISVHVNLDEPVDEQTRLIAQRMEAFWRRRARLPNTWFPMVGEVTYYLSPHQALEYGIVDEILDEKTSVPWAPEPGPAR